MKDEKIKIGFQDRFILNLTRFIKNPPETPSDQHNLHPMKLTAQHIKLVQQSWRNLRDINPQIIADLFYTKLFFDHPEARGLFPKDMTAQHQKLIDMLNVVVARLDHLETLTTEIDAMGKRHVTYGAQPQHYEWVGAALLWTLKRGIGMDWTPELEEAWTICYQSLAAQMTSND